MEASSDLESMAACLLAEGGETTWARALTALRRDDGAAFGFFGRLVSREELFGLAHVAVEHVSYLPSRKATAAMSDSAPPVSWNPPDAAPAPSVAEPVQTRDAEPVEARSRGPLVVVNNNYADGGDRAVLAAIAGLEERVAAFALGFSQLATAVNSVENKIMVAFADLMQQVERQTTVVDGVVAYVQGQKQQLDALQASLDAVKDQLDNGTDAELQAAIDQMRANNERAVAAITANTPEPAPEPQPEQPAPEQPAEPAPAEPVAEQPAPEQPSEPAPAEPAPAEPAPDASAPAPDGTGTVTG